jgi:hypothetical protein
MPLLIASQLKIRKPKIKIAKASQKRITHEYDFPPFPDEDFFPRPPLVEPDTFFAGDFVPVSLRPAIN